MPVYDDQDKDTKPSAGDDEIRRLSDITGIPEKKFHAARENAERQAGNPYAYKKPQPELDKANIPSHAFRMEVPGGGKLGKLGKFFFGNSKRKRNTAVGSGSLVVSVAGTVIIFSTYFTGPFELIHFGQLLSKFHLAAGEDAADDMSMRTMLYTIAGASNRSRLSALTRANNRADKWEARIIAQSGLKPVYTGDFSNRFAGYQIVDPVKARDLVGELERQGIESKNVPGNNVVDSRGKPLTGNRTNTFIDMRDTKYKTRRIVIRAVTRSIGTSKLSSAIGSRLLIKRAGVDFHPIKNVKRKYVYDAAGRKIAGSDKKAEEKYLEEQQKATAERDLHGADVDVKKVGKDERTDENGNPIDNSDPSQGNDLIGQAKEAGAKPGNGAMDALKNIASKAVGPAAIITILCAMIGFGEDADEYAHQQDQIIERMGFRSVAEAHQVMANHDLNIDAVHATQDTLHDEKNNTHWNQARSIRAEEGKPATGPEIPETAKPTKDRTVFMEIIDFIASIPLLPQVCDVANAILDLPIIKQIVSLGDAAVTAVADAVLAQWGLSLDKVMLMALQSAANRAVNVYAEGAEKGGLANYGARMAARDQALAMGGRELSEAEETESDTLARNLMEYDQQNKSFAARYFDLYNADSALSRTMREVPESRQQLVASLTKLPQTFGNTLANLFTLGNPRLVQAQSASDYDYGFKMAGFSISELSDSRFDDPGEIEANNLYVEPRLEDLNDKYSKCFGIKVNAETLDLVNGETPTRKYLQEHKECHNRSLEFLRYRFYLAHSVAARSMACDDGDTKSCKMIGMDS